MILYIYIYMYMVFSQCIGYIRHALMFISQKTGLVFTGLTKTVAGVCMRQEGQNTELLHAQTSDCEETMSHSVFSAYTDIS